jgi:hypothetical protein
MIETPEMRHNARTAPTRNPHRATATPGWLAALLTVATLALATALCLTAQPSWDLWWQMKTGELILRSGHVPTTDPFSFTAPGHPWIAQEWAVEVLFYLLYRSLGPLALVGFKLLAAAAAFGLLFARSLRRGGDLAVTVILALVAAEATRWYLNIRPQEVSFVLLGALLWILEERRRPRRPGRGLPPSNGVSRDPQSATRDGLLQWAPVGIMLVWVNSHAAFIVGLGIVAAYAFEAWWEGERGREWVRHWGLPGAATLGATLVNPYSYHALLYPFALTGNKLMMWLNGEWISPDLQGLYARPYLGLILVTLAAFALSSRPRRFADVALVCGALHLSLVSNRHVPLFALAVTPILVEHASDVLRVRWLRPASSGRTVALAAAVGLYLMVALPMRLTRLPRENWFNYCAGMGTFPVAACDFMDRQGWTGRVYHELVWGGYLIWRYDGRVPVFVDGRSQVSSI